MTDPVDRDRRGAEEGLSSLATGYRAAERYTGAVFVLVGSVGILSWAGYKLDQRWGHRVPWLLLIGALVGMIGGFVSFFKVVLGTRTEKETRKGKQ